MSNHLSHAEAPSIHRKFARRFRPGRAFLILFSALLLLISSGFGYEWYASRQAESDYPPPGKLVDAGGYKLHINKIGSGSPTILLEAASGETSLSWKDIPKELADTATVVTYDRGGFAWSEKATTPRTGPNIVRELHTALKNEGIQGPYILVGHSLGGMYSRLFAQTYRNEVAGLVLIDAKPEDDDLKTAPILEREHFQKPTPSAFVSKLLKQSGVMRILQDVLLDGLVQKSDRPAFINVIAQPKYFDAVEEEGQSVPMLADMVRGHNLGALPIRVVARGLVPKENAQAGLSKEAGQRIEEIWQEGQREMLKLSTDSRLIVAKKSGHYIIHDEPGLVVKVIKDLVKETPEES
ncbi:alpha/beta hydrolase [Paenibacillus zeisoli]|uniref:Alpha/beta hydrolase n=1 Tax=Paenibacillus zeisoli TaxID=2496267 RepID=A0A3S1B8R5_9BACL|nr:alpha/beta hydrolase [Paenibacillus zeisoli]RUT35525.1 alpha/beta hydrolase [Paenibacillus zeisoli]